jgi:hypothetical protein
MEARINKHALIEARINTCFQYKESHVFEVIQR